MIGRSEDQSGFLEQITQPNEISVTTNLRSAVQFRHSPKILVNFTIRAQTSGPTLWYRAHPDELFQRVTDTET